MRYSNAIIVFKGGDAVEVNDRIKAVRNALQLTQTEFGNKIGLKQNTVGQLETGLRKVTDRTIIVVCQSLNVNENWLRTGEGAMFGGDNSEPIEEITAQYNLSPVQTELIKSIIKMPNAQRDPIVNFILALSDALQQSTSGDFDYDDFGKTQSFHIAACNGSDHIDLNQEQRKEISKLVEEAKSQDPPEGVF